jgi:uncharacterized protein
MSPGTVGREEFPTHAMLLQTFDTDLDSRLQWLNPPQQWHIDRTARVLVVEPRAETDFWQRTHYGFRADNGHFLNLEVSGDFALATQVRFFPEHEYDQAGLLIRADAGHWIKTAVEHELDGRPKLGAVVTNFGYSDWSLQEFPSAGNEVRLRMRKHGADVTVEWSVGEPAGWKPMRIAHLHIDAAQPLACGLYACSPKAAGFRAEFACLSVAPYAG